MKYLLQQLGAVGKSPFYEAAGWTLLKKTLCADWHKASLLCGTQITRVRIDGEVV